MSGRIVVICESPTDKPILVGLSEKVLLENIHWMRGNPSALPLFGGLHPDNEYEDWKKLDVTLEKFGDAEGWGKFSNLRYTGEGKRVVAYANRANKFLQMVRTYAKDADAVILFVDVDTQPERHTGFSQAREIHKQHLTICIGVADPKIECWVLSGFIAQNSQEKQRIDDFFIESTVHPIRETHKLKERQEPNGRNAKHVFRELIGSDSDRKQLCLKTDLEILRLNGKENGLNEFLDELKSHLVPIFDKH